MSSQSPAALFAFSPLDVTFPRRCKGLLDVWGVEPGDCGSLQGVPDPSLLVWHPRRLPADADRVCCWSAGWPTCLQTHTREQKSHTHTHMHEPASSNARDVHMLSNKLRPNDEQRMTCELRLHAQQYNGYYVNTFIPSVHEQSDCSESRMCWDIRSRSCWNF